MDIKVTRFHKFERSFAAGEIVGFADVSIGGIRVRGVCAKVINGKPHLDFPSERGSDGKWYPVCFPETAQARAAITQAVFKAADAASKTDTAEEEA